MRECFWEPDPGSGCFAPDDPACPPRWYNDPLVLDLDGDGIPTTTVDAGVDFDITGDGQRERIAWTLPDANDALWYFDHNHNGIIDGVRELFGDATDLPDGAQSRHGFEALAMYDKNNDGALLVQSAKIAVLHLEYATASAATAFGADEAGNQHRFIGTFATKVTTEPLPMHDIFLRWRR